MLEARVVIALVARYLDFVKVGWHVYVTFDLWSCLMRSSLQVGIGELSVNEHGKPILDEKGHYKVTEEMYPVCWFSGRLTASIG